MPTFSSLLSRSRSKSKHTPNPATNPTPIHTYTLCPHTSPPMHRPLNTQPITDPNTGTSSISGRCADCDQVFRRDAESAILTAYGVSIRTIERQAGVFDADFLATQVAELVRARDEAVRNVWRGFSRRWGPGCVGRTDGGRMRLAWERPDVVDREEGEK